MTENNSRRLWIRCGDQDDYHGFDDIVDAAEYLKKMGVTAIQSICTIYGVQSPEYRGPWNYISIYWGDAEKQPTRPLTQEELDAVQAAFPPVLDEFTRAYIRAALWSSNDESNEQGGEPLDAHYDESDIAPATLAAMVADCRKFQKEHATDIAEDLERAGHDFWLSRNHHGSNFLDGDWAAGPAERLMEAAHKYGEVNLYVGDDGKVYAM